MVELAHTSVLSSLPIARTRLIGREAERAAARAFLLDDAAPLLTLTGPGGVGKTRLALAIAHDVASQFIGGVVWVDLAPLTDASLVPATVAAALNLSSAPDQSFTHVLLHHLRPQQALLLLDNCEHVLDAAAALVTALLDRCPALQVLATSRAPLHLHGEQALPIDPLPLPPAQDSSPAILAQNVAVRLFTERTRAVRPSFQLEPGNAVAVAALCHRLDGLPLARKRGANRSTPRRSGCCAPPGTRHG